MDLKLISYWVLSIITLTCCLFISSNDNNSTAAPLNLTNILKVEPKFFYYIDNKYHAKISEELVLDIKTDTLTNDVTQYDTVVINDLKLDLNSTISLNWSVGDQLHQIQLNNTQTSITPIDFKVTSTDEISQLYILIKPNFELGKPIVLEREATFQSIYLDTQNNQKIIPARTSQWFNFNPIKFNSINGYSDADNFNFKDLIFRLMIWIFLTVLFFKLLDISGTQLIATLAIAWIIPMSIFAHNFVNQHQQISAAYPNNYAFLNVQDKEAFNIAQSIKSSLTDNPNWHLDKTKFIILGLQDYNNLRLFHHLVDLNVGLSSNIEKLTDDASGKFVYIFANTNQPHCHEPDYFEHLGAEVEILDANLQACLVRKK